MRTFLAGAPAGRLAAAYALWWAALRLADQWLEESTRFRAPVAVLLVALMLFSVSIAVGGSPGYWLGAAAVAAVLVSLWARPARQQHRRDVLLDASRRTDRRPTPGPGGFTGG